jgi:16S rRNA (cytosine967-C5)-methyltransferase
LKFSAQACAARVVGRVLTEGGSLERVLPEATKDITDPRLKAAVQDLAYGSLRHLGTFKAVLDRLVLRPITDAELRHILLVGLYQLQYGKAPDYAVVNECVSAVPARHRGARGMVNAVLRAFIRQRDEVLASVSVLPEARYNHPEWWVALLQKAWPQDWETILDAGQQRPPMTLRINRRKLTMEDYLRHLDAASLPAIQLDDLSVMLERPVPVSVLPGFREGWVSVQDWGARIAANLIDLKDGQRVLDACAAPGGKTGAMLELADLDCLALDRDAARLARVAENLSRLGFSAELRRAEAGNLDAWWDGRPFQRILLDAPCSASGVVRRHPDAKWLRREADVARFAREQARLLDALWQALGLGGKLLYATCSMFPEENLGVVAAFLENHGDAIRLPLDIAGAQDGQLLPDARHDGFYYALLQRT